MKSRKWKYEQFEEFRKSIADRVEEYKNKDESLKQFTEERGIYPTPPDFFTKPGHRICGVKFGKRPFDYIENFEIVEGGLNPVSKQLLTEEGAVLHYGRGDDGSVACCLYPAHTENRKPHESLILLGVLSSASKLNGTVLFALHWRCFISYARVTSLDHKPTIADRIIVELLRFSCRLKIGEEIQGTRLWAATKQILKTSLTVGLSGFLLKIIVSD